ncbi:MAG TPA: hypothetical protein VLA72_03640 [Anaerolineales bacterium]|nr:hypothetical protein [Anaerolineales bacterium]
MELLFVLIYIFAAMCCLIILFSSFLDFRASENLQSEGVLFALLEIVIATFVNIVSLKQPFWRDIFFPILLSSIALIWIISQMLNGVLRKIPWIIMDLPGYEKHRSGIRPCAQYIGFWYTITPKRFVETL